MEQCFQERIFYYWKHSLYGHVALICDKATENKRNDIYLIIWRSLTQAVLGDINQSINTLNSIRHRSDLHFLITVSSYYIQKLAQNPNFNIIQNLKEQILKENHNLTPFVSKIASQISFLFNDYQLAEEIINNSDKTIQTLSILGWIKMMKGQLHESEVIFDNILNDPVNSFHLLTLYGKGHLLSQMKQSAEVIQIYARILSKFDFPEINFEKEIIYISKGNWHSLEEMMITFNDSLPTTLEIDIFNFFNAFYQTGNISIAKESIEKVIKNCELYESQNWFLMARLAHAFGTLSCRNVDVLFHSMKLAQMAVNARPNSSYCLSVLGYHQIMNNRMIAGRNSLYESIELDQTNEFAEENIMRMNIKCKKIDLLKDQLDLFNYLNVKKLPLLLFIVKVSRIQHHENHGALYRLIQNIDELITSSMKDQKVKQFFSFELSSGFFSKFELPFNNIINLTINLAFETIFDALDEVMLYYESPKIFFNSKVKNLIKNILKNLFVLIPESSSVRFYMGCFLFIERKYNESLTMFQTILVSIWPCKVSYSLLMISAIYSYQGEFELAKKYLKEAASLDSLISNEILYQLIDLAIDPTQSKMQKEFDFLLESFDKQSFMNTMKFVDIFIQNKEYSKASEILNMMISKFTSKNEKAFIIIRQAKIHASRNDLNQALSLLNKLKNHSKFSEMIIKTKAEIYLNFFNDDTNYIQTFVQNSNSFPTSRNYELLGDAYSQLKKFDEASEAYTKSIFGQNGIEFNLNFECIHKCIKNLIRCHRYNDAVFTFIKVVPQMKSNKQEIILLIHQMMTIERLKDVKKCIINISSTLSKSSSYSSLIDAEFFGIKASIFKESGDIIEVIQCYEKSIGIFEEILNNRQNNIYIKTLKEKASELSIEAGLFFESLQKREKAFEYYSKAQRLMPTNEKALNLLVTFFKQKFEMNKCASLCEEFLSNDPYNENVVFLYTSLQHKNLKKSIAVLVNFLTFKPHSHRALVRLIEICSRVGENEIMLAKKFLSSANEPGMVFARGVFNVYKGEIESALKCFEKVGNDRKWGVAAKTSMFLIYLNPEGRYIWESDEPLSSPENIQKAKELFDQIYSQKYKNENDDDDMQFSIEKELLYAELEKSINTDSSIASAISRYSNIINNYQKMNIPAIVGLASCNMRLLKPNESISLIDQVIKSNICLNMTNESSLDQFLRPTHETVLYFEEAYLMRAKMILNENNSNNQQSALHFILLALELNQSCKKGWEMCAEAYSRSNMYSDAANAYKHCWSLSANQIYVNEKIKRKCEMKNIDLYREKVTEIGYSYTISLMEAKRPEDAIEMCQKILDINPCFKELKNRVIIPSFRMLKS